MARAPEHCSSTYLHSYLNNHSSSRAKMHRHACHCVPALQHHRREQLAAADQIDPGYLALLAGTDAALRMLDAEAALAEDDPVAERAVLVDQAEHVKLILYAGAACVAAVTLTPRRALAIAGQMIAAASRRWPA
jgi:hypothetical protein